MITPQEPLARILTDLAEIGRRLVETSESALALLERAEAQCDLPERQADPTPMPISKPMLMTAGQVANELQIHPRTLRRLIASGQGPQPIKVRGATRWRRSTVEKWVARRES